MESNNNKSMIIVGSVIAVSEAKCSVSQGFHRSARRTLQPIREVDSIIARIAFSVCRHDKDTDLRRPAAASHVELDSDLSRFMVRLIQPGNCMMASTYFFPPSEYFHSATIACSLSSGSLSSPSIRTNRET